MNGIMDFDALSKDELSALFVNDVFHDFIDSYRYKKNVSEKLKALNGEQYTAASFEIGQQLYIIKNYGTDFIAEIKDTVEKTVFSALAGDEYFCPAAGMNGSFFLLLKGEGKENAARLKTMFEAVTEKLACGKRSAKVTFICGLYAVDGVSDSFVDIIDKSVSAMHYAETISTNTTEIAEYSNEIQDRAVIEGRLADDLKNAIANNELIIEIQPKFSLETGECVSAEALVRWNHPVFGRLSPDRFIPIAERTGAVIDIDMFVLETVCKYMRMWMDTGCNPVPVAVNQSRLHITDPNYVNDVFTLMQSYDVWPSLIILETTESIAFDDYATVTEVLRQLREYGFILSIDDFGSGYSSLHMLNELEYNELKLDQKLINSGSDSERSRILLRSIVDLAHALDMTVVAEGVETEKQAELLKDIGCDNVQGFLYAYPMEISAFEASVFGKVLPR